MLQQRLAPALSGQRYRPFTYLPGQDVDIHINKRHRQHPFINCHQHPSTTIHHPCDYIPRASTTNAPSN